MFLLRDRRVLQFGLASFLLHFGFVAYLRAMERPKAPDIEELPDRFVRMLVKKRPSRPSCRRRRRSRSPSPPRRRKTKPEAPGHQAGQQVADAAQAQSAGRSGGGGAAAAKSRLAWLSSFRTSACSRC